MLDLSQALTILQAIPEEARPVRWQPKTPQHTFPYYLSSGRSPDHIRTRFWLWVSLNPTAWYQGLQGEITASFTIDRFRHFEADREGAISSIQDVKNRW